IVSPSSGGTGGSFISLPWEGNTNAKLVSFGVVPATLTLGCPTGTAQVGVAYSSALVASGGVAPYTFSIISGSLPPGLTLNASTGAITGTPTTAGTYNFTAQVVDSQGNTATSSCSIVVSPSTLTLSCPTGTAQVGFAYSSALVASGGVAPYTFSIISGSLPPGLTLNASTGAITGTPTTAGTYNFTAQVVDSKGNTASASCSIVVTPAALTLSCPTGTGQVGVGYSSALMASGGVAPYTFSIVSGSLPPGLTLNTSTGAITGTPTTAGTYNFTAQVVDSKGNTATASCSVVVSSTALTLSCPTGTAQLGVAYSSALVASGGVAPYTFSIISGSLPPGLTLNASTGAITGTPNTAGTYNFTAQVVDSKGNTASASCSIVVSMQTLSLTCPIGTAQVGVAYSSALVATGGNAPYTFSIISGSLPPGLSLNSSTGAITGTPTTAGMFNFTARVMDSQGNTATTGCGIVVSTLAITVTCPTNTAQVGVAYSSAIAATGGVAPYTFSLIGGFLPPGLTLNPSTGAVTGTPTTGGTFSFTVQVVDSQGNTATASCGIVVSSVTLVLSCPTGTAQVGVAYSSALVATGGVAPYTFSLISGSLPPGLTLNPSTGAITGTPTTGGTYNFTAKVADSQGNTATASCSITVFIPTALTLSCPAGTAQVGIAYSSALSAMGGVPGYKFAIINGSLPSGLTLNTSTGAITGAPTTTGTYNFTAQVVDSQGNTTTASCSIVVASATASPSTTSLALAPSSVPLGSSGPVVMTATVTPTSGGGTPTGTVTFFNGPTQVGTATLSGGVGTFNYNPSSLAVGIYSITAVYGGDSTFAPSTSSPQTLAISQTGPFAYVANNSSNTVSVINIPTGQVVNNIPVGSGPVGTAISPDQTQVYVTNNQGNSVSVINAASGTVVATIPVQSSPFGVAFTPDGTQAYIVNGSSNTVSVINTATQTVVATVPVQNSPVGVAMAPTSNGTFAYVANSGSNTVSVIAVTSNPTVVQTIPVGTGPRWVTVSPNSALAYVENAGSNNVSVISVASNKVTSTIPVGTSPFGADFTPDNSTVYVANSGSNTVSVIDTQSGTVIYTVTGLNNPVRVAFTMDGSSAYVTNLNANTVSVIDTQSIPPKVVATVAGFNAPTGVAIASAPQMTLQITQPLSSTQPNPFNFGSNTYTVQYPAGTQFSNVSMTVTAVEITQAQFQQRVKGTKFANASCIVYGGGAGNCIDEQVACYLNGSPVSCPSEGTPSIAVQTNFTTEQGITNPGYLTTPIGQNEWKDIFTGFSDITVKGKTQGFSEFIAVNLGATDPQGSANFELLKPKLPRNYEYGVLIPIEFKLTSVANGKPVNHAKAGLSVVMIADAKGNPTDVVIYEKTRAFEEIAPGLYKHDLAAGLGAGTYAITIYGESFPAYQGQFKILH
ncbi:MAG: putative Ig domain-containing protein, partial [Terriglobales bacterium]